MERAETGGVPGGAGAERCREKAREKLLSHIFPNFPETEEERAALEKAVDFQAEADLEGGDIPEAVEGFQIGHFRAELRKRRGGSSPVCPLARSVLLRHGLLYKGLEGRSRPVMAAERQEAEAAEDPLLPFALPLKRRTRDAWQRGRREDGNPPPRGIPPQGEPPLPGLPGKREMEEEKWRDS